MWQKEKNKNPIVSLALLLALAATPMITTLLKSDYVLAQSSTGTRSFPLPTAVPDGSTVRVDGSTSMTRANEALKQRFEKKYSGSKVELATNGTEDALKALQEGKIDIAAIGRGLKPEDLEKQGFEQQRLRREKIAIIVGKDNPFKGDLSNQLFTKIYRGQITNWSQLGGPDQKIRVLDHPDTSDIREAFRNYPSFKDNLDTGSTATKLDSYDPAEVVKQLGKDGISFVLANQVSKLDNVRVLSMHKVLPTNEKYPYSQPLVYVYKKNPSEAVKNFVGFATAAPGQEALKQARKEEAEAVAATVARTLSGDNNSTATADEEATATPGSTEAATGDDTKTATTGNEAGDSGAGDDTKTATTGNEAGDSNVGDDTKTATTGNVTADNAKETASNPTATNTSNSESDGSEKEVSYRGESAGASTQIAPTIIDWRWILLPIALFGALVFWWLLGRRKSQEDDTVARGVLPDNAPPPFTPTSTSTSGAVKEPVANTPGTETSLEMNTAPVEPAANTTPGINAAGIAAGVAGLGLGAAALSSKDREDTSEVRENPEEETSAQLPLDAPTISQPDISNRELDLDIEAPTLQQPDISLDTEAPDIPDNGLDLEAPAAVVNNSYPSVPLIPKSTDDEIVPPTEPGNTVPQEIETSPQEELPPVARNNWLGNFALGGAAAGAQRIKSKLAGKDAPESTTSPTSPEDNSTQINQSPSSETVSDAKLEVDEGTKYPQLPDVWDTQETDTPKNEVQENSSFSLDSAAAAAAGLAGGDAAMGSRLFNRDNDDTSDEGNNTEENNNPEEQSQVAQQTSPSELWGTPETETPNKEEQENSSFSLGNAAAAAAGLAGGAAAIGSRLFNRDNDDTSDEGNNTEENNNPEEQSQVAQQTSPSELWGTPETETPNKEEQENSSFSLGGAAAAAAGLAGGAAAIGSRLFNRDNDDTYDGSNNIEENSNPEEESQVAQQTSSSDLWGTPETETPNSDVSEPKVFEETSSVSTPDLPEVRITTSNEQLADAQTTPPQEQQTSDGLPNVWVTPSNTQPTVTEEETTNSEDNPALNVGSVVAGSAAIGAAALGSQILRDRESQEVDQNRSDEDLALDKIAEEAEVENDVLTSEQDSDTEQTSQVMVDNIGNSGDTKLPTDSYIILANRTPKWAYTSWFITPADREAIGNKGGNQLVLRLYDATDLDLSYQNAKLVQQYECEEIVNHRYVAIPNTERDYIAEVGYITKNKEWLLVSRSPIIRVFNRPEKDFWFEADAELIIHGATEPGSIVTIEGQNIKVKQDGTFHLRVPFTDNLINYLITAAASNSEQSKTIHMQFSQSDRENS